MGLLSMWSWLVSGAAVVAALAACTGGPTGDAPKPLGIAEYSFTGPYTHENLTVYLIHGKDKMPGKAFLTLTEAMEQKKVLVYDNKDVNTLQIENVSDEEVWVQSGDIVKGGRQDRTFANDCIIPKKSGKVDMAAFCVESGRWRARGKEDTANFSANANTVVGNNLKMALAKSSVAADHSGEQSNVWANVGEQQEKLSKSMGKSAKAAESATSLQLTLEKPEVKASADGYRKALEKLLVGRDDAIGFAVAINGKVQMVDVYGNHALFEKLWPKLAEATAVEALAEKQPGKAFAAVTPADVRATIAAAQDGKEIGNKAVGSRATVKARDNDKAMMTECLDSSTAQPARTSIYSH